MVYQSGVFSIRCFFILSNYQNKFGWYRIVYVLCCMKDETTRKEVRLHNDVIERLQELADKKKWKLKIYMEDVLVKDSIKAGKLKKKSDEK